MIDYVVKLTKDATRVSPEDHDRLRRPASTTARSSRSR